MAVIIFFCWYYPIGLYRNAEPTDSVTLRGFQLFLFLWMFLIFASTFTHMVIAGVETAENGGNIANLLFMLCLLFCGVLAQPSDFPRFWIFMYRLSPFTYLVSGMLSVGLANSYVTCADRELVKFEPANGATCGEYMKAYQTNFGGRVLDPNATSSCEFCSIEDTNVFLASISSDYTLAWRNFGKSSPRHYDLDFMLISVRHPLGVRHLQHRRCPRSLLAHPHAQEQEEQGR